MPLPLLAMLAPGAIQSGFGLAGLLSKRKKFEGTSRGRALGRRAGEGALSPQQEREVQNRLLQHLLTSAGEETEEIKRAIFPMLEKSRLAGARLLSAPYRDVRGKMTDAELRLQAGERQAAMEAGQQFGAEREKFEESEDARRGASMQQLIGGLTSMGTVGAAKATGLLEGDYEEYALMSLLGMRPPAYFRPKQKQVSELPFKMPKITGIGSSTQALELFEASGLPASLWEPFKLAYWDSIEEEEKGEDSTMIKHRGTVDPAQLSRLDTGSMWRQAQFHSKVPRGF